MKPGGIIVISRQLSLSWLLKDIALFIGCHYNYYVVQIVPLLLVLIH